jgi:hypothetical protein
MWELCIRERFDYRAPLCVYTGEGLPCCIREKESLVQNVVLEFPIEVISLCISIDVILSYV